VALAGLNARAEQYRGKNVVVIVCGGNISRDTLRQVI
jgi:threonine dehydratase